MKVVLIKRLWLRRLVMLVTVPFVLFEYLYYGLRALLRDFGQCWCFRG